MTGRTTRRSVRWGAAHLLVALGVGGVAAWAVPAGLAAHRDDQIAERRTDPPAALRLGDRAEEALAELRRDGVYVSPDGRSIMDAAGEREVEEAVAANPVPVYVVVWAEGQEIGNDVLNLQDALAEQLGPEPGMLYLWQGPESGAAVQVGPDDVELDGTISEFDFLGDAADVLAAAATDVSIDEEASDLTDTEDALGGPGVLGGAVLGGLLAATVVGLALLLGRVVAALRGRGLVPGRWTWTEETR